MNEFIDMQRVRDALFSCMINRQIVNIVKQPQDEWFSRQPDAKGMCEKFIRDGHQNVVAYTCQLKSGKTVTADLNKDFSISKISIDGKPDILWQDAYSEGVSNARKAREFFY